jgi:hypothetical protein
MIYDGGHSGQHRIALMTLHVTEIQYFNMSSTDGMRISVLELSSHCLVDQVLIHKLFFVKQLNIQQLCSFIWEGGGELQHSHAENLNGHSKHSNVSLTSQHKLIKEMKYVFVNKFWKELMCCFPYPRHLFEEHEPNLMELNLTKLTLNSFKSINLI